MKDLRSPLAIGLPVLALVFLTTSVARAADPITQQWLVPLGTYVDSAPSQGADGTIFVGTAYALLAYDLSGNQKWSFSYNNGSMKGGSAVPLADGGVVFVTLGGQVTRLNSEGDVVWQNVYGSGTSQPIALGADGTIYHGDRDWKIYATNPDGSHKWSFDTGGAIYGGPVIGRDGTIYCGSDDSKLYALKPDGSLRWDLNLGTMIKMPPVIGDDGTIYVVGENGKLYAISPSGAKNWEYAGYAWPPHYYQPIIGLDGAIYYPVSDRFVAINPNGTLRWEAHLATGIVVGAVALADGSFYVIDSRRIYHLESDGTERRQYLHDFYGPPPLVTADGTIYMGHHDNAFAALTGGIGPADTAWPMLQRDSLRTGRRPQLPAVDLLLPVDSSTFVSGHNVPLRARALNLPAVDRVDFYRGATLLSSDNTEPFEASWTSSGTAPQTFSAIAYFGALSVTSEVSTINLLSSRPNTLPSAQIVTPTNNTSVVAGSALRISAQASDPDGAVLSVEVFDGNTSVGSAAFPDFNVTIGTLTPGEHLLKAVATDNFGGKGTSAVVRAYAVHKKWEYAQPQYSGFRSPALGTDGSILVGASEWIYALNNTGQETWVRHLGSAAINTPISVAADGTLYFGTSDARLFARYADGTAKWDFPLDGQVTRAPAIGEDGTIYTGGSGGKLFAVLPDGTKKWDYIAAGNLSAPPVIGGDGTVYFGTGNGYFTALDEAGQFKWEFHVDGGISSAPAIGADGTLYFGSGNAGKFFAVTPEGGQKWMLPISSGVANASPSIAADGTIYCGSYDGTLLAIRPNGTLKWSLPLGGEVQGTPAVAADGSLYLGNGYGRKFFRISSTGIKIWEFANTSSFDFSPSPLILDSGDVVAATGAQVILLGGTSAPGGGPWPMFMQNRRHTGQGWIGPVPTLVEPPAEASYVTGTAIPLSVDVSASRNPVVRVEYLSNSNVVLTLFSAPFAGTWNAPGGVHHVQARAADDQGAVRTSGPHRIKVVPPGTAPSILAQPAPMTDTANGSNVVLRVDIFGSGPLSYQWYRDGGLLAGETSSQLSLDNVTTGSSARYTVLVSNAAGQIWSAPSVVNVLQRVVERWVSSSGTKIFTTPAMGQGTVFNYGNESGDVSAYDPRGNFEWGFRADLTQNGDAFMNDRILSSPAIHTNGVIHFGTEAGRFYQLHADGTRLRRFDTPGFSQSSPALGADGTIYFGTSGGSLRAYTSTGGFLWQIPVAGAAKGAPAIGSDGRIYFTSEGVHLGNDVYSGRLNAVTPTGQFLWSYITGNRVGSSPAIGADGTLYFGSSDHKFYAITPAGAKLWDFVTDGPVGSAVIGTDGTIYFGNTGPFDPVAGFRSGKFYALTPAGQLKWFYQAGGAIGSIPAIAADGTIYFGAENWQVYALNPNGTLRWKHALSGAIQAGLTIGSDGTVYVPSLDSRFYALFENPSPLANSPWPKFKHDLRGTGNVATTNEAPEWVFPFGSNAFNEEVTTIAVEGNHVFVGGAFTIAGGRAANYVARWDGSTWSALGSGASGLVSALAWFNGQLYMGGYFMQAGGQDLRYLARWNGSAWLPVGDGVNGPVRDLVVHNGSLFVGGEFGIAGGIDNDVDGMARWDGSAWHTTGTNAPVDPRALAVVNGVLHAGVPNLGPPEARSYGVLRWIGSGWEEVARGLNDHLNTLAYYNGQLHVGGRFSHAGTLAVNGIARWTGSSWQPLGGGMGHWLTPDVRALLVHDNALYAAGFFQEAGGVPANNLARWNGSAWSALGTGLTRGTPNGMPVGEALAPQGSALFVGGTFLAANDDRDIRHFARWVDGNFEALGKPLSYKDGVFRLTLFPDWGVSYGIEASNDLQNWQRLITFTNLTQAAEFIDNDAAQNPTRFYRAVSP